MAIGLVISRLIVDVKMVYRWPNSFTTSHVERRTQGRYELALSKELVWLVETVSVSFEISYIIVQLGSELLDRSNSIKVTLLLNLLTLTKKAYRPRSNVTNPCSEKVVLIKVVSD